MPEEPMTCRAETYRRREHVWFGSTHPFLERAEPPLAPASRASTYHAHLHGPLQAVVADHVVNGRVIFPAVGYLEMLRAAAGSGTVLRSVFFLQPLALDFAYGIKCAVHDDGFEVYSTDETSENIVMCCTGSLGRHDGWKCVEIPSVRVSAIAHVVPPCQSYGSCTDAGLQYGPAFRRLSAAWSDGSTVCAALQPRRPDMQGGVQLLGKVHVCDVHLAARRGRAGAADGRWPTAHAAHMSPRAAAHRDLVSPLVRGPCCRARVPWQRAPVVGRVAPGALAHDRRAPSGLRAGDRRGLPQPGVIVVAGAEVTDREGVKLPCLRHACGAPRCSLVPVLLSCQNARSKITPEPRDMVFYHTYLR